MAIADILPLARRALAVPVVYRTFGRIIGASSGRDDFARRHIRPRAGDRVLDIGCGPADILSHLPRVDYVGFDANPEYIATAKRTHGASGRVTHTTRAPEGRSAQFYCKLVAGEALDQHRDFDIVLALGILHHLDDTEAEHLFQIASSALRPGGRLVTLDGVYIDGQSRVAKYLISRDRGQYVRRERGYLDLAKRVFPNVEPVVRHDMLNVPYTHLILECTR